VSATMHGEEDAGTLSVIENFDRIFNRAKERSVGVILYPCTNASGFNARSRYNELGQRPNNWFIVYSVNNRIVEDLRESDQFDAWMWASDPLLKIDLPLETALLHAELKVLPFERIKGMVDLHQDHFRTDLKTYAYVFDRKREYARIMRQVEGLGIPILSNEPVESGYAPSLVAEDIPVTDKMGFVIRHDGSLQDLFHRKGVPYTVTVETTGPVPLEKAMEANYVWIDGIMGLASGLPKKSSICP